jgi:hypothetical protein
MQLARILEDWILDELCHPDGFVNGNALCPFARNAWLGEKVKTLEVEGDLWDAVYKEMRTFDDTYQVVVCGNYDDKYTYEDLEAACFASERMVGCRRVLISGCCRSRTKD